MKTIYKYPLEIKDIQDILITQGAEFLSVVEQDDLPVVYFLVDPSRNQFPIEFILLGTGRTFKGDHPEDFLFLGTVSTHSGQLVWHIFAKRSLAWWKQK